MALEFPTNFLWGAATAAHQVEGNIKNDWSVWEQHNAVRLAQTAEERLLRQLSILGTWPDNWQLHKLQASDPQNYISGDGIDHYHLYSQDLDLLQQLNLNTYRFSVEWARVEPERGCFNEDALWHYKKVLQELKQRGVTSVVTLYHFTLPTWFAKNGGWLQRNAVKLFQRYVSKVVAVLGDDVDYWLTMNEPAVYSIAAFSDRDFPPQHHNFGQLAWVWYRLGRAHIAAYSEIKRQLPKSKVGLTINMVYMEHSRNMFILTRWLSQLVGYLKNHWFLDRVRKRIDFIGVNNYVRFSFKSEILHQPRKLSDLGWELCPESLYEVVIGAHRRFKLPILITEHGLADTSDRYREWFITESLKGLHQAIQQGANVFGYLHWSLLDNFEWDKGWWPKFGLIAVDRVTQTRQIRQSSKVYAKIAKENAI